MKKTNPGFRNDAHHPQKIHIFHAFLLGTPQPPCCQCKVIQPSGHWKEVYRGSIQLDHGKQRCFSICTYSKSCVTFLIEEDGSLITCQFYSKSAELLNLVEDSGTSTIILYSVVQRYRSCLDWYTLAGARTNGTYEIVNENNQFVKVECTLEFVTCLGVYNQGFRDNGKYQINENGQTVDKECKLELTTCIDVYNLGFRDNGKYHLVVTTVW